MTQQRVPSRGSRRAGARGRVDAMADRRRTAGTVVEANARARRSVSLCVSLLSLFSRGGARETEARARVAVDFGWAIERIETNRRRARRGRARGVGVGYGTGDET